MENYSKYREKNLFEQPSKDEVTQTLFDIKAQQEADRIIDKFRNRPVYLNAVAMRLAQHVLKSKPTNDTQNDLLVSAD